ncbi:MAG: hypothetical protein DWI54_00855 [Chloroflexi bacterium]|nr:MAG: hypothetical protein DWI54_00855 [Chloroflexota bacterium]
MQTVILTTAVMLLVSCTPPAPRAAEPTIIVVPFGSDRTPTAIATAVAVAPARMMLGASKAQVDELLADWASRPDRTSTSTTDVYRYTRGVTMIVAFRNDQAIGVYVIDNPGAGVTGIAPALVAELSTLIGAEPDAADVISDEYGIREFGVGDVTSW